MTDHNIMMPHKHDERGNIVECPPYCPVELDRKQAIVDHDNLVKERLAALPDFKDTLTFEVYATEEEAPATEWLALPKNEIPELVKKYTEALEENPRGFCSCLYRQMAPEDGGGLRRIDEDESCIMHNRRGLIQGFFVWLEKYGN